MSHVLEIEARGKTFGGQLGGLGQPMWCSGCGAQGCGPEALAGLRAGMGPNGFYFRPLGSQVARNKIRLAASRPWGLPRLLGPLRGPPSALLGRSWRARVRACVHAQGWAIHACVALACFPNPRLRPDRLRRAPAFRITDRARIAHCGRIVLVHGLSDYGLF